MVMMVSAVTGTPESELWSMTMGTFMRRVKLIPEILPLVNPLAALGDRIIPSGRGEPSSSEHTNVTINGKAVSTPQQFLGMLMPFVNVEQAQ